MLERARTVKGFDVDRIIYSSQFSTTQSAMDYIGGLSDWYDLLDAGTATGTANIGDSDIVISSGSLKTDGVLAVGDIWSPDEGVSWYNVLAVPDDDTITLRCPLQIANISGLDIVIARPKFRKLILDSADNLDTLIYGSTTEFKPAIFLSIINQAGGIFRAPSDPSVVVEATMQGVQTHHNLIIINVDDTGTVYQAAVTSAKPASQHLTLHMEEYGCHYECQAVDLFEPSDAYGSVVLRNGYYEGRQDMMFIQPSGEYSIYDSTIVGRTTTIGGANVTPNMFSTLPQIMQRSTLRLDNSKAVPITASNMMNTSQQPVDGSAMVHDDCIYEFIGANSTDLGFLRDWVNTGVGVPDLTCNSCTFDATGVTTGNVELVETKVYTGAGSLTLNQCTQTGGFVDGAGGTFTVTTNP